MTMITLLTQEEGHRVLYTRYTMRAASISIIPEFLEKINLLGWSDRFHVTRDEITNITTGSSIIFRGIKASSGLEVANLKSLTGVTTWVMDEAEELTDEDVFDTINLSVRQANIQCRVILMMNPSTKEHFIYRKFFTDRGVSEGSNLTKDDTTYIHTTYLDNIENLGESFIKEVNRLKERDPIKYEHKLLGGWLSKAEGVVFNKWSFGEFNPNGLQTSFGCDFGFSVDPDTLTEVAIDSVNMKIYVKQCIYTNGLKTHVLARTMKSFTGEKLVVADSASPRTIADLDHAGVNIKGVKKGTIESGITRMLDFDMILSPNSTDIAKELDNYVYSDKRSNLYIDDWNHAIDGIRYNIIHHLDNPNLGTYSVFF